MRAAANLPAVTPFNAYAAFEREREHSRRMEALLMRSNTLLKLALLSGALKDADAVRGFLAECGR